VIGPETVSSFLRKSTSASVNPVCNDQPRHGVLRPPLASLLDQSSPFRSFKISPEIIRLAVMLYVQIALSLRDAEEALAHRQVEHLQNACVAVAVWLKNSDVNLRIFRHRMSLLKRATGAGCSGGCLRMRLEDYLIKH
jgi:hypothetical protein